MKITTKLTIRKMGNSQGVIIPKAVLTQLGLEGEAEMSVERDSIVLRRPRSGDDGLVWPEFANAGDAELVW